MEFLLEIEDRGYPTEYLLARIRGRRSALMGESVRMRFLREPAWIYHQMNNRLRNIFRPYFIYSELNTVLVCLRYRTAKGSSPETAHLLESSLLSDKMRDLMQHDADLTAVLKILEKRVSFIRYNAAGLERSFLEEGLKGVEQKITAALFEYILNMDTDPLLKRFFVYIIDARNIITLHKHLRWDTTSLPLFIEGGQIKKALLAGILRSYDTEALADLICRQTGIRVAEQDAARIDNALQRRLTGKIKKWERENPETGLVLNYLWWCATEAKNLSILHHGRGIGKDILKEELVH
ncbi:MAG: V-type ATPase subunit [Nitrospirota bacterium]